MLTSPKKKAPRWTSLWSMSALRRSLPGQDPGAGGQKEILSKDQSPHVIEGGSVNVQRPHAARAKSVAFVEPETAASENTDFPTTLRLLSLDGTDLGKIVDIGQRSLTATGGVASISIGRLSSTGAEVVLKEIFRAGAQDTGREDIFWLKATRCDHVLPFLGRTFTSSATFLVSPFMPNGDLAGCLRNGALCSPVDVAKYLRQVLSGLRFLHEELDPCVVHGDLKADNVMIDERGNARISDFGLSRHHYSQPGDPVTAPGVRTMGTRLYLSVEQHQSGVMLWDGALPFEPEQPVPGDADAQQLISKLLENDLWAVGILIVHMYTLRVPWDHVFDGSLVRLDSYLGMGLRHWYPTGTLARERGLDFRLWRVAHECWSQLPSHRPRASELLRRLEVAPLVLDRSLGGSVTLERELIDISDEIYDTWPDHAVKLSLDFLNHASHVPPKDSVQFHCYWVPAELNPPRKAQVVFATCRQPQHSVDGDGWCQDLRNEVVIWSQLRHENLLPLIGVAKIRGVWHTITPFWQSARQFKEAYCDQLTRKRPHEVLQKGVPLLKVLYAVASALQFLHNQDPPIAHGSVMLDNVFVGNRWEPKIRPGLPARFDTYADACLGDYSQLRSLEPGESVERLSSDVHKFGVMLREYLGDMFIFPDEKDSNQISTDAVDEDSVAALYGRCMDASVFLAMDDVVEMLQSLITAASLGATRSTT